jgi:Protein of unknown function (DUF2924)
MPAPSKAARRSTPSAPVAAASVDLAGLSSELARLEKLGFDDLRVQWRNRWGRLAPARLPRSLLYRVMAYRLQAEAFGDLDRETKRLLDRLADRMAADDPSEENDETTAHTTPSVTSIPRPVAYAALPVLKPGALLTREWKGRIERVMVLEEGFAWNGKTYSSVSAVALAITGVKWNGRRFFFGNGDRYSGGGGRREGSTDRGDERRNKSGRPTFAGRPTDELSAPGPPSSLLPGAAAR